MAEVASHLLDELCRCFGNLLDSKQKGHNPIYIIAALLDPRYMILLDPEHVAYARKECLKCKNVELESSDEDATNGHDASVGVSQLPSTSDGETGDTGMIEPPCKQFREQADELLYIDWLVQQKATEKKVAQRNPKLPQIQVDGYIESIDGQSSRKTLLPSGSNPPTQSRYSLGSVFICCSGAYFFTARKAAIGRRNQLTKNLEKKVLLKGTKSITLIVCKI